MLRYLIVLDDRIYQRRVYRLQFLHSQPLHQPIISGGIVRLELCYGHVFHNVEFREPQCIYVGSVVENMADGLARCIAKAYLFKTSPLREWVPKSIAAGNPMTVSINGSADIMRSGDLFDVIHFTELQSIDWANPGTEGMETSKAMSVVNEMNQNKGGNENMAEQTAQDIMKNMTVAEFKAYNPTGYDGLLKGLTVQELQAVNPGLYAEEIQHCLLHILPTLLTGSGSRSIVHAAHFTYEWMGC